MSISAFNTWVKRDGAQADLADWVGLCERYRLHQLADGGTRLEVDPLKMPEEYAPLMNEMWPKALDQLRQICVSWPPRLIPS